MSNVSAPGLQKAVSPDTGLVYVWQISPEALKFSESDLFQTGAQPLLYFHTHNEKIIFKCILLNYVIKMR